MEDIEENILGYLNLNEEIPNSHNFACGHEIKHDKLESVIKRLKGFEIIDAEDIKKEWWDLAGEGIKYVVDGSPEVQFFSAIPPAGSLWRTHRPLKGYSLRKGPKYLRKRKKAATYLTREHLQSFWNFGALFQPQHHPARDSHTFFLKVPSTTKKFPEDYVERVKHAHVSGGYRS